MMWVLSLIAGPRMKKLAVIVLGVGALTLLVFKLGVSNERVKNEVEELEEFKETVERIDATPINTELDAALDRLRRNGDIRESNM